MNYLPLRRGLQIRGNPAGRPIKAWETPYDRLVATLGDPGLIACVTFGVLGLLVALNAILCFPDLGALIEQYNQF